MHVDSALEGLKVADFSWAAAGPITTRMLADHGATVVRIESLVHMDSVRITGPFRDDIRGINKSGFFADFNSSKLSLSLNMTMPEAFEIAKRLISWSDVVIETFTPRVMTKWGISYEQIREWKPDIIMLSSCMQGQTGPNRTYSGFGNQGGAIAGLHYLTGWADRDPSGPKGAYTDAIAPRYAIAAILAAVEYRRRTGRGQYIDLSQVEAATSGFLATELLDYSVNGRVAERRANRSVYSAPHGIFPCVGSDRWVTIAVEDEDQWHGLCAAMGDPAWARAASFATMDDRLAHVEALEAAISDWTAPQEAAALVERLQTFGVPSGVVQNSADLFADPQLEHRGHFRELDHVEMGTTRYNGPSHLLSETPAVLRWAAPLLGEHTNEVLEMLGFSEDEVEKFASINLLQ
jgi:benzylsuccinate CoA-transferase BbsF subunit